MRLIVDADTWIIERVAEPLAARLPTEHSPHWLAGHLFLATGLTVVATFMLLRERYPTIDVFAVGIGFVMLASTVYALQAFALDRRVRRDASSGNGQALAPSTRLSQFFFRVTLLPMVVLQLALPTMIALLSAGFAGERTLPEVVLANLGTPLLWAAYVFNACRSLPPPLARRQKEELMPAAFAASPG